MSQTNRSRLILRLSKEKIANGSKIGSKEVWSSGTKNDIVECSNNQDVAIPSLEPNISVIQNYNYESSNYEQGVEVNMVDTDIVINENYNIEEFNISFFTPKKDQCELCISYDNSDSVEKVLLQEKYDTHLKEKVLSRLEKEKDKQSNCVTADYDLQAVLPCPLGNASSFYYVSKLNVFNFTVYNLQTNDVQCYVWHEGQAHRGANDIGSCILNYLKVLQEKVAATEDNTQLNVIFYSDNCAGQRKNKFILAMYLYAVLNFSHINSITHKYLITGHTQNEGDNAHSVIEKHIKKSKKSGPIYVPEQYVTFIRSAKKSGNLYKVQEMCYKDFFDLKDLTTNLGINIFSNKNLNGNTFKITEVKMFKVTNDDPGTIYFKNSYEQMEFDSISIKTKKTRKNSDQFQNNNIIELKKAYDVKPDITEAKKSRLLSLIKKNCVPNYYYDFYNNL